MGQGLGFGVRGQGSGVRGQGRGLVFGEWRDWNYRTRFQGLGFIVGE